MKEESTKAKNFILPFLVVLLINILCFLLLHFQFALDLGSTLLFAGCINIVLGVYPFFKEIERNGPYEGDSQPYDPKGNFTAFFQAKSLITSSKKVETPRINLNHMIIFILFGVLSIASSFIIFYF